MHSQETEERLLGQNETLKRENEQLQERLKAMEQVTLDKDKRNRKLTYMVVAAVLLIVFYFVLGRVSIHCLAKTEARNEIDAVSEEVRREWRYLSRK